MASAMMWYLAIATVSAGSVRMGASFYEMPTTMARCRPADQGGRV